MALGRPLGRETPAWEVQQGLWPLAASLGSEMALDLKERKYQKGNEMGTG